MTAAAKNHGRRSRWTPPPIDATFVHDIDGTVWTVKGIDRPSRQVHLYCPAESLHRWPHADQLDREYTRVEDAS